MKKSKDVSPEMMDPKFQGVVKRWVDKQGIKKGIVTRAARKTRSPRAYRVFNYRGVTFFFAVKDGNTSIYVLNKDTQLPEHQLDVPKERAVKAAQALAKMILTKNYLDDVQVFETKDNLIEQSE